MLNTDVAIMNFFSEMNKFKTNANELLVDNHKFSESLKEMKLLIEKVEETFIVHYCDFCPDHLMNTNTYHSVSHFFGWSKRDDHLCTYHSVLHKHTSTMLHIIDQTKDASLEFFIELFVQIELLKMATNVH